MNEEERHNLDLRARNYIIGGPKFGELTHDQQFKINLYIKGALDQDPISRKAQTEKIIRFFKSTDTSIDWNIETVVKFLETL
jgi:hypothetical protein